MIQTLEIQNFQSHKKTKVDFAEGVNVIVGPSDSGKTALLRALQWVIWNRPLGDAFRSDWGGDTLVRVDLGEVVVERFKGKHDHYKLYTKGEKEPIEFKAFGTEVPDEIQKALNLSDINIQEQMDSPFLISNNPGEVSRHFNKIANIDKIDSSLRAVESWTRAINSDIKSTQQEIERYQEQSEQFAYLDKMEVDVEVLEQLAQTRTNYKKQHSKLNQILEDFAETEESIITASTLLPAESKVEALLELTAEKEQIETTCKQITKTLDSLDYIQGQLITASKLLEAEDAIESVFELYNKKESKTSDYQALMNLAKSVSSLNKEIKHEKEQLEELESTWHEIAPEVCPLCEGTGKL